MRTGKIIAISIVLVVLAGSAAFAQAPETPKLHRFQENDKWGFKDGAGNVVVKPVYDLAREFSCGLAAVNIGAQRQIPRKMGGKWGYINAKGEVVVPITLGFANDFSEDLALVGNKDDDLWRYIDPKGKTVITLEGVSGAGDFSEGLAYVQDFHRPGEKDRTRFIDKTGKTVLTVDGYAEEFHEGLSAFSIPNPKVRDRRLSGFVNRKGEVVIQPVYAEVKRFSEGLAAVRPKMTTGVYGRGDEWGYIDMTGKYVIEPSFNQALRFVKGVAWVHVGGKYQMLYDAPGFWAEGEWRLIDKTGKVLEVRGDNVGLPAAPKDSTDSGKA